MHESTNYWTRAARLRIQRRRLIAAGGLSLTGLGAAAGLACGKKTAGSQTVTATDISDGTKAANTSSAIPVNSAGFVKLLLLVPGETAVPGTTSGKTGTPA